MGIGAAILAGIALVVVIAMNKGHREQTGINAPTTREYRNIRRNAKRRGIPVEQAYEEWLARELKKHGKA